MKLLFYLVFRRQKFDTGDLQTIYFLDFMKLIKIGILL